jgi:hypothetical protein
MAHGALHGVVACCYLLNAGAMIAWAVCGLIRNRRRVPNPPSCMMYLVASTPHLAVTFLSTKQPPRLRTMMALNGCVTLSMMSLWGRMVRRTLGARAAAREDARVARALLLGRGRGVMIRPQAGDAGYTVVAVSIVEVAPDGSVLMVRKASGLHTIWQITDHADVTELRRWWMTVPPAEIDDSTFQELLALRQCCRISAADPLDAAVARELEVACDGSIVEAQRERRRAHRAAIAIAMAWRRCVSDPAHPACGRRLLREFSAFQDETRPPENAGGRA